MAGRPPRAVLPQTSAAEGFYRTAWTSSSTTTARLTMDTDEILYTGDDPTEAVDYAVRAGPLRPPGELGRQEPTPSSSSMTTSLTTRPSPSSQQQQQTTSSAVKPQPPMMNVLSASATSLQTMVHPGILQSRERIAEAVRRGRQHENVAWNEAYLDELGHGNNDSLSTSFCFQGMEVIFATTSTPRPACYGACARTLLVFQTLDLGPFNDHSGEELPPILSILANPVTGQIVLTQQDGSIHTYYPEPVRAQETAFGKWRWWNGPRFQAASIFYQAGEEHQFQSSHMPPASTTEGGTELATAPGRRLDISLSNDYKLLVAHRNQLAVLDVSPYQGGRAANIPWSLIPHAHGDDDHDDRRSKREQAEMLWTVRLPGNVVTAKISGNAYSIAVVLEGQPAEIDEAEADGVHTFERDLYDGSSTHHHHHMNHRATTTDSTIQADSSDNISLLQTTSSMSSGLGGAVSATTSTASHRQAVGILFRPGPFLVHSAPVTRLSFRGLGHLTSEVPQSFGVEQSNDLLLTYCQSDCTARIFAQSRWKPLTDWVTPVNTRVDWVRGISAFSLGDLEGPRRSSLGSSTSSSATAASPAASTAAHRADDPASSNDAAEAINETLGKRHHIHSIPSHTTLASDAGAWISEITFQGPYPSLRLSRLTYLKRGTNDLSPTLFESVLGYLPTGCLVRESVLSSEDSAFCIEGVWPIWNAVTSEATDVETQDTLKGSAMAFLGLTNSVASSVGGYFGGSLLTGAQNPPAEIRMTASHVQKGNVTLLQLPVWMDPEQSCLELGYPHRSVLSICDMECSPPDHDQGESIVSDAMDYQTGLLYACVDPSSQSIHVTWRKQGTMSILPDNWLPEDADPLRTGRLMANTTRFQDVSLMPFPLYLPHLSLPRNWTEKQQSICHITWWPDEYLDGTPYLVAMTSQGTIIVYEMPPPWSFLEPELPVVDDVEEGGLDDAPSTEDTDRDDVGPFEYEVSIIPDPDFGLGMRLESQPEGLCAVAGSYKKHPITGEDLPAEKCGLVKLGDELISANGVSLEGISFDDIIRQVRDVGTSCGPGNPIRMRFRRNATSPRPANSGQPEGRRTYEQIIGIKPTSSPRAGFNETEPLSSLNEPSNRYGRRTSGKKQAATSSGTMLGHFPKAVTVSQSGLSTEAGKPVCTFAPATSWIDQQSSSLMRVSTLFVYSADFLYAFELSVGFHGDMPRADLRRLGKSKTTPTEPTSSCRALSAIEAGDDEYIVLCFDQSSVVRFTKVIIKSADNHVEASFTHLSSFGLNMVLPSKIVFRSSSIDLMGVLTCSAKAKVDTITVWSMIPLPEFVERTTPSVSDAHRDYWSQEILLSSTLESDEFLDFCFLQTGFLEAMPSIIAYLSKKAILFSKPGGINEWVPSLQFRFSPLPTSKLGQYPMNGTAELYTQNSSARHRFPHLASLMLNMFSSVDEEEILRSDWHPEAIVSSLCLDTSGVEKTLSSSVRNVLLWMCAEVKDVPEDHLEGPLIIAPSTIIQPDDEAEFARDFTSLDSSHQPVSSDTTAMQLLRKLLAERAKKTSGITEVTPQTPPIPPLLQKMCSEDAAILFSVVTLLLEPLDFQSLDGTAQLFWFSANLNRILESLHVNSETRPLPSANRIGSTPQLDTTYLSQWISSGACMATVLSNSQTKILQLIRQSGWKLDWSLARQLRLPFWVRSDKTLAAIAEEIGQNIYREKRDIMECAIFFIVARKVRTLRNLAAADQSDTGRKLLQFLNNHDFSSPKGRQAAEKNAFSLLRKCKYSMAAAFFLLAEPPALRLAIDTILTKMQDSDLAFLVARVMESRATESSLIVSVGGGGIVGGGGGYAGVGNVIDNDFSNEAKSVDNWKPEIGAETKWLLVEHLLPSSRTDDATTSLLLLWLDRKQEASWFLAGSLIASYSPIPAFESLNSASRRNFGCHWPPVLTLETPQRALIKANSIIDMALRPILVAKLGESPQALLASILLLSDSLCRSGLELSSLKALRNYARLLGQMDTKGADSANQLTDTGDLSKRNDSASLTNGAGKGTGNGAGLGMSALGTYGGVRSNGVAGYEVSSSIFDSFEAPLQVKKYADPPVESSIFSSYDVPPAKQRPPVTNQDGLGQLQSSIFDSFDVPHAAQSNRGLPTLGTQVTASVESSIFDAFDVPPQAKKEMPKSQQVGQVVQNLAPELKGAKERSVDPTATLPRTVDHQDVPGIWLDWKMDILLRASVRRLIRNIATLVAEFHGDPRFVALNAGFTENDVVLSPRVSEVLQLPCDGLNLIARITSFLEDASKQCGLSLTFVCRTALKAIGDRNDHRVIFDVLLHLALGRGDLAEETVRAAANGLLFKSYTFAFSFDSIAQGKLTKAFVSSHVLRLAGARLSWQLESCLWLHRGGGFPLSGAALREVVLAARMGLVLSSWNRDFECLGALLSTEPDCPTDDEGGRHFWSSLKATTPAKREAASRKSTSGGWEFLVNCRRSEATQMLRNRVTGSFLIRPHAQDRGVFTLSFKTNLIPDDEDNTDGETCTPDVSGDELSDPEVRQLSKTRGKKVKKDDVVQHAIIRLSDSGFRCGSFGPFASLIELLEAVSGSLPFQLRFDLPPTNRVIQEEGSQTSPNAVLLRKLAIRHADTLASNPPLDPDMSSRPPSAYKTWSSGDSTSSSYVSSLGRCAELCILGGLRRQFSSIASVGYEDIPVTFNEDSLDRDVNALADEQYIGSRSADWHTRFVTAQRMLAPILTWCRTLEVNVVGDLAPSLNWFKLIARASAVNVTEMHEAIEVAQQHNAGKSNTNDTILRRMIQQGSGVEFSTLRMVDSGECTLLVLFRRSEAVNWLIENGFELSESESFDRIERMEKERVIEVIDLSSLPLKQKTIHMDDEGLRYRFVDPWEVEVLDGREGETRSALLGRERYLGFSFGKVGLACDHVLRSIGGSHLVELWTISKGSVILTKALACIHPPWERDAGGDLRLSQGNVSEAPPFLNSIRQSLYRNALFRTLSLPQRFMGLIQIELLDLKNLTSPGGSLSLNVYALLRLKRAGLGSALTNKARTLDSAATQPVKLGKSSGPNAAASWGSVVRFRFPLPEDVSVDGVSRDTDREVLFRGPPRYLQVCVYEKKLLVDHALGTADISLDGLSAGAQLEEWVPLRSEKHGISWFARFRLTLRFELMCLASDLDATAAPSVGLRRIEGLTRAGGSAHEDKHKRSMSSPDLLSYFESMVY